MSKFIPLIGNPDTDKIQADISVSINRIVDIQGHILGRLIEIDKKIDAQENQIESLRDEINRLKKRVTTLEAN